ncbi:hypothetical protein SLS63_010577 [Diaporthe eres]|uniref:BTB domain-containing protein n=1 Tax=Diaporthe eres TaxID=83184 RepID=A0ABR1NWJ6_DIAER
MEIAEEGRGVNLGALLKSGTFSDLQLSCEGRDFAVHKAILCSQSRVISAECEGNFEESRTNVIKIEEFNAETVHAMLEFLYCGDYSVTPSHNESKYLDPRLDVSAQAGENGDEVSRMNEFFDSVAAVTKQRLSTHLYANAIGDYYDIQPLCTLARSKVKREFEEHWHLDNFTHLLRETCQTRKTGDIEFHRLLGQIAVEHPDDSAWLEAVEAEGLDIPLSVTTSFVGSCIDRVRHLDRKLRDQALTIDVLEGELMKERNPPPWLRRRPE